MLRITQPYFNFSYYRLKAPYSGVQKFDFVKRVLLVSEAIIRGCIGLVMIVQICIACPRVAHFAFYTQKLHKWFKNLACSDLVALVYKIAYGQKVLSTTPENYACVLMKDLH